MSSISNFLGYLLNFIYNIVNNYGLAIILFSILIKIVLLPLSIKQQKAMKKNAKMQVEIKEMQDKYKSNPYDPLCGGIEARYNSLSFLSLKLLYALTLVG